MKIWIVNPFDNLPLEGYRPQRFWLMARALVRAGHDVTLWTCDFSHANKRRRDLGNVTLDAKGFAHCDGFRVAFVHALPYSRNICVSRIISHIVLSRRWTALAEAETAPDAVVASSPPLSLCAAARRYCDGRGIPFVVDVMDAWPETFERLLPGFLLSPLRFVAKRNYLGAAAISVVAERYASLVASYGAMCTVRLFHHGISRDQPVTARAETRRADGSLRLAYIGSMGKSYDLVTLVSAVLQMPEVTLDLAGGGPCEAALRKMAEGVDRIRFHGYLSKGEVETLLGSADAGMVPMFSESCVGVPYKLADYALAGLPVVNSLGGETRELLSKYNAGMSYEAGNIESLKEVLSRLAGSDLSPLRAGALRLAEYFDADVIYREYAAWLLHIVAKFNQSNITKM